MDWFLYDRDLRHERVNARNFFTIKPFISNASEHWFMWEYGQEVDKKCRQQNLRLKWMTVYIVKFKQMSYLVLMPGLCLFTGYPVSNCLTPFLAIFHFYTPWKRQKAKFFLTFSWGVEMEHCREMGYSRQNIVQLTLFSLKKYRNVFKTLQTI